MVVLNFDAIALPNRLGVLASVCVFAADLIGVLTGVLKG